MMYLTCTGFVWILACAGFEYYCSGYPHGEVVEISSSSCDLSIFSMKASSHCDEGAGVTPGGCRVRA
jgi:hypothetical protein